MSDQTVRVASGRAFGPMGPWGYTAMVDADGRVWVQDPSSGTYTSMHRLTPRQEAYVRRLAAMEDI